MTGQRPAQRPAPIVRAQRIGYLVLGVLLTAAILAVTAYRSL
jgi:hypothetical protein